MILAFVLVFALVFAFLVALVFVLIPFIAALAQEMSKKQQANAASAQQATRNQQLQDTMLLIAALRTLCVKPFSLAVISTTLPQQMCEKKAPHAPATRKTASNHEVIQF
jgi:hypothetical protein